MNLLTHSITRILVALLFVFAVIGWAKIEADRESVSASEVKPMVAKPYYIAAGTGPAVYGPGDLYTLLATGDQTNGGLFQFEAVVPKGGGPPPHIHHGEDESFYLVKGTLEVLVEDKVYTANPGDFVYVPRGTVHRFKNVGEETAVQLVTFVPSGMEGFFNEVFHKVENRNDATPPITEELIQRMNKVGPKYGLSCVYSG